jgi:hypothetical protein
MIDEWQTTFSTIFQTKCSNKKTVHMYVKVQRVDRRKEVRLVLAVIVATQIENVAIH